MESKVYLSLSLSRTSRMKPQTYINAIKRRWVLKHTSPRSASIMVVLHFVKLTCALHTACYFLMTRLTIEFNDRNAFFLNAIRWKCCKIIQWFNFSTKFLMGYLSNQKQERTVAAREASFEVLTLELIYINEGRSNTVLKLQAPQQAQKYHDFKRIAPCWQQVVREMLSIKGNFHMSCASKPKYVAWNESHHILNSWKKRNVSILRL